MKLCLCNYGFSSVSCWRAAYISYEDGSFSQHLSFRFSPSGSSLSHCAGCWPPSSTAAPSGSWDASQRRTKWTWSWTLITFSQVKDRCWRFCFLNLGNWCCIVTSELLKTLLWSSTDRPPSVAPPKQARLTALEQFSCLFPWQHNLFTINFIWDWVGHAFAEWDGRCAGVVRFDPEVNDDRAKTS